ncbi:urokinase plasminogen activator surface receptor-like [Danio aesculapii]|uniref:urokinase plasminogen activator surface receptor-like n=1 Tax=Danio aesculapii TaxID=1142201 RepID=UPI0024C04EEE|nr:urokinase plasminogen activator surface receptor-like [Danio aesculapii]
MDLQVSVFLLFAAFTSGYSLSCYQCDGILGSCAEQTEKTCSSEQSKCASITVVRKFGTTSSTTKAKDCAADCASGILNFGYSKMSHVCCNSDQCNKKDAQVPTTDTPNGNTCYSCNENNCFNVLSCSGNEDRCIKATVTVRSMSAVVKGCASKSICDAKSVPSLHDISCCSGNLCNGAKSVTQSFLILCFPLIAFILML